jgi:hypothetical protein
VGEVLYFIGWGGVIGRGENKALVDCCSTSGFRPCLIDGLPVAAATSFLHRRVVRSLQISCNIVPRALIKKLRL